MFLIIACAVVILLHDFINAEPAQILSQQDGQPIDSGSHRFEDFFWTGSGDGPGPPERAAILEPGYPVHSDEEDSILTPGTRTVVSTTTLLATLYLEPIGSESINGTLNLTRTPIPTPCALDCGGTPPAAGTGAGTIQPTRPLSGSEARYPPVDRRYWLLTILATDTGRGGGGAGVEWETKLAGLYSTAFARQLERHLGLLNRSNAWPESSNISNAKMHNRQKKRSAHEVELINSTAPVSKREIGAKPQVSVYVHNVSTEARTGRTELLYSVLAGGRPVLAETAAEDMRLVTDEEASAELGFPVLTKSEPYLRSVQQGSSWGERATSQFSEPWLMATVAIAACILLLLLVTLIVIAAHKRNRRSKASNTVQGKDNEAFAAGEGNQSKTGDVLEDPAMSTITKDVKFVKQRSFSSASGESADSPMYMPRRRLLRQGGGHHGIYSQVSPKSKQYHIKSKLKSSNAKKRRGHNAVGAAGNEWAREDFDRSSSDQTSGDALVDNKPSSAGSIGSYLSLPSVRSFPRCDVPEPLSRILEPTSVHCLDWEGEGGDLRRHPGLVRHLSMGAADPGIIGPMVWNLHCKTVESRGPGEPNVMPTYRPSAENVESSARLSQRRYRDLIDGAMQLWNAPASAEDHQSVPADKDADGQQRSLDRNILDTVRGRSAIVKASTEESAAAAARPRSAAPRRPRESEGPKLQPSPSKRAWGSGAPSPLVRPLSAGPFHRPPSPPRVDVGRVLAPDPSFAQHDSSASAASASVAPLLAAIQQQLEKFSNTSDA